MALVIINDVHLTFRRKGPLCWGSLIPPTLEMLADIKERIQILPHLPASNHLALLNGAYRISARNRGSVGLTRSTVSSVLYCQLREQVNHLSSDAD